VTCSDTKPGDGVFLTGSHAALGNWLPVNAVALNTCAKTWPSWTTSSPIPLPPGRPIEFKFLVQDENKNGTPRWESFDGNRVVSIQPGVLVSVLSSWDAPNSWVEATPEKPVLVSPAPEIAMQRCPSYNTLLLSAEACTPEAVAATAEVCPHAVALANRTPSRRNFSQSLLELEPDEPQDEDNKYQLQLEHNKDELQRVTSISALELLCPPEEKTAKGRYTDAKYEPRNLDVPVVIVTSEIAPFSKTGGLGLVAASYSYEFAVRGHRTMAVSPMYKDFENVSYVGETEVLLDGAKHKVKYWHRKEDFGDGFSCDHIFVEHSAIKRGGGLYNDDGGREYPDNLFRFSLLSLAAMEAPLLLEINGFKYGQKVIFLANDWQSGLIPMYMNYKYRPNGTYLDSRVIYVVHNLGYQGRYHNVNAERFFGVDGKAASDLRIGNSVNLTKAALICADRVLTVSPNYAQEIQTPANGFELQDFARARNADKRLSGILNGIDDCWDPISDPYIHRNFCVEDFEEAKDINKVHLQRKLDLREDPNVVLIGFVGRLTWQKGIDVLDEVIDWLMQDTGNGVTGNVQLIMMGNGEPKHSQMLRNAEGRYKTRVCGYVGFDPKVEHQMMAGCDLLLMPSRYEPCGLPQMYAQQYGTLPVVHATGGLKDSVRDFQNHGHNGSTATGFHLPRLDPGTLKEKLYTAMELYLKNKEEFRKMQRAAMQTDFYWPRAVDEYERHFDDTLDGAPTRR